MPDMCLNILQRVLYFKKSHLEYICVLLLLLSHFICVRLCVTPEMAAQQAPPSLGFSRQEHWSGLPFPSPMHESEKWRWSRSVVSNSQRPHGLQPTRLCRPWDSPGKNTGVGCHFLLRMYQQWDFITQALSYFPPSPPEFKLPKGKDFVSFDDPRICNTAHRYLLTVWKQFNSSCDISVSIN